MPKVTNETNAPLKVIVAYEIRVENLIPSGLGGARWEKVDINHAPQSGAISISSDAVTWVLQPSETQYVECRHTNDIIFSTNVDEGWDYEVHPFSTWIAGEIDPDEHIHIMWVGHWQISNNEGGSSHHNFRQ